MLYAVDLFSGAGGFLVGLQKEFKVLFSCEIDKAACATHYLNFPNIKLFADDIKNLSKEEINGLVNGNDVDLVVGGPPCQGFSVFGKRRFINTRGYDPKSDERNKLVYEFMRVVKELQPKYFIMENVKGFVSLDDGKFVKTIIQEFRDMGFKDIEYEIVCAADYGVPQERYRMIMIGNRIGQKVAFPDATHFPTNSIFEPKYLTVGETIMDLVSSDAPNHVPLKHKPLVAERMSFIKEGHKLNLDELPERLLDATRSDSKTGKIKNYSHIYKRLHREKPAWTIVPGHNAFPVHPILNRTLTVREAARIQTFPDSHVFCGTRQQQCIQVGNAIPPRLVEIFSKHIADKINKYYNEIEIRENQVI